MRSADVDDDPTAIGRVTKSRGGKGGDSEPEGTNQEDSVVVEALNLRNNVRNG